jgi:hypothetical protein
MHLPDSIPVPVEWDPPLAKFTFQNEHERIVVGSVVERHPANLNPKK